MSSRKIFFVFLIVVALIVLFYNSFFPRFLVIGTYKAKIYDEFATHGIKNGDKLILNDDGTFQSDTWGEGRFIIKGSDIEFHFIDSHHQENHHHTYLSRPYFFGNPRIVIFRDLNSEYIKE